MERFCNDFASYKTQCMLPDQAHKFLTGFAPIRSVVRVGTAAGALLAIPAEQLRGRDGAASSQLPRPAPPPLSRQIQRSLTGEGLRMGLLYGSAWLARCSISLDYRNSCQHAPVCSSLLVSAHPGTCVT